MTYLTRRKLILSSVLAKKGEVENVVTKTKQAREAEEVKLSQVTDALKHEIKQLREIEEALLDIEQNGAEYVAEVIERIKESYSLLKKSDETILAFLETIAKLDEIIELEKLKLSAILSEQETASRSLDSESIRLANFAKDLNVYRSRLEKLIKENNLDIKIIEP